MKKILLGFLICFVLIIGGCAMMFSAGASSVNSAIETTQSNIEKEDEKIKEITDNIKWEVIDENYITKIIGVFENTSNKSIEYVQFDYKLLDKNGMVIEKAFTNETDIAPGEKRKVEILCGENNFDSYEIVSKSSAL